MAESPTAATDELARIDLLRFPVQIRGRAQQHHEGLMREFALIANPHPASEHDIPVRLLRIVVDLPTATVASPTSQRRAGRGG